MLSTQTWPYHSGIKVWGFSKYQSTSQRPVIRWYTAVLQVTAELYYQWVVLLDTCSAVSHQRDSSVC